MMFLRISSLQNFNGKTIPHGERLIPVRDIKEVVEAGKDLGGNESCYILMKDTPRTTYLVAGDITHIQSRLNECRNDREF